MDVAGFFVASNSAVLSLPPLNLNSAIFLDGRTGEQIIMEHPSRSYRSNTCKEDISK